MRIFSGRSVKEWVRLVVAILCVGNSIGLLKEADYSDGVRKDGPKVLLGVILFPLGIWAWPRQTAEQMEIRRLREEKSALDKIVRQKNQLKSLRKDVRVLREQLRSGQIDDDERDSDTNRTT